MKSTLTEIQRSHVYLEDQLNFRIENETAHCRNPKCNFNTINFLEAEEHWYKTHYIWQ